MSRYDPAALGRNTCTYNNEFWSPALHKQILIRLDRLNTSNAPEQMSLPGFIIMP